MRKLFIDDLRHPPDTSWYVVRSVSEAINYMMLNGCPDYISFDYCLAHGQTIMPLIDWMMSEDERQKGQFIPPGFDFQSHSSATEGRFLITQTLQRYLQKRKNMK